MEDYPHARQLKQIPYAKDLVKRLRRNPYLRKACGYQDKAPNKTHFTQMKIRFDADDLQRTQMHVRLLQFI